MRRVVAAVLVLWAAAVPAGELPVIREITFAGNDTTRPEVMLREMVVRVGDPAEPERIERSRQGIQDLGLFRSVTVTEEAVADGVRLTFVVREKWYILPIPRVDASSEGESAYGVALRWYNVDGRNHTFRGNWARRDEEKANKGEAEFYGVSYTMPFVLGTPYGLSFGAGYAETPITDFGGYLETSRTASIALSRAFGEGPASQGWTGTLSVGWNQQDAEGPNAPDPYGRATTLGAGAVYRDVRDRIFSDEGITGSLNVAGAAKGAGSDYSYTVVSGQVRRYLAVGTRAHQNVNVAAAFGSYHGGPTEYTTSAGPFNLGGASRLRGYPGDFVVGDFYYHLEAEYLRPLRYDWLRLVLIAEAGNAFEDASAISGRVHASIGLGLRVRFSFLVNAEFELGVAWPSDRGGSRIFASRV